MKDVLLAQSEGIWVNRQLGIVIAALATAMLLTWLASQKTPVEPRTTPPHSEQRKDYSGDVQQLVDSAATADQAALERFNGSLDSFLGEYQTDSLTAAESAAAAVSTYDSIRMVVGKLAYDEITGSNEADRYIEEQVGPFLGQPIETLAANVNTALATLDNDLRKTSVQLAVDLATLGPAESPTSKRFAPSGDVRQDFDKALKNLGIDTASIGVAIVFDVYAITKASVVRRLVVSLTSLASGLFAKQVAKVVISISGPMMDGPLPIGDLVALVSLAWTAYDISRLQPKFYTEVKTASANHLSETGAEWDAKLRDHAKVQVARYRDVQSLMGQESLKLLVN